LLHPAARVGSNTAMRYCMVLGLLIISDGASMSAAEPAAKVTATALQAVLVKNVGHAREWLQQSDFKSLAQSAGGLQLLAELTKSQSDDAAWQAALGNVISTVGEIQAAARSEDLAASKVALAGLEKAVSAAAALEPTGQPQVLPRPPAIRSLMLTMDAIQGDAKVALLTGNVEAGKKQAGALAELARLVSNSRNTPQWTALAGDFAKAAIDAATATETDPKAVRQLFRGVAQRCEACHENSRTR